MCTPNPPQYTIREKLGKGSNATVFKAISKKNRSNIVAVKCINKKLLNKAANENLFSEIKILKEVKHENIVEMLDFMWDSNYIYIVLEYCAGGDLSSYIRSHEYLDEIVMHRFLQQLAAALQSLHRQNVLHMDLKPHNILLTASSRPKLKIADFGFAQCLEPGAEVTLEHLRGSLLYMAPEVYLEGLYSAKCDLWSVGVIIHECLVGRAPFHSQTVEELKVKLMDNSLVTIPTENADGVTISMECRALMTGLLQRDVTARMSYDAFLEDSYVDLEHAPCRDSLTKAETALNAARDRERRWEQRRQRQATLRQTRARHREMDCTVELGSTYQAYLDGLSHMMAAIQYEENTTQRNQLRKTLQNEFEHVETLKLKLDNATRSNDLDSRSEKQTLSNIGNTEELEHLRDLEKMCYCNSQLLGAISKLKSFYFLVEHNKFQSALEKFQVIFDEIYRLFKQETDPNRKEALYAELQHAMGLAERIKPMTKIQSLDKMRRERDANDSCLVS